MSGLPPLEPNLTHIEMQELRVISTALEAGRLNFLEASDLDFLEKLRALFIHYGINMHLSDNKRALFVAIKRRITRGFPRAQ